jgi:protein-tyrosine phosphatase
MEPRARGVYLRRRAARWLRRKHLTPVAPKRPASILFVCHGNIMRSALAEALLTARVSAAGATDVVVRSAGLHARSGKGADPRMVRAALRHHVSLDAHRATPLSLDLVTHATAVFVMDYVNDAELRARFPDVGTKILLLGVMEPSAEAGVEIADPYTQDEASVDHCAARVARCVALLAEQLELSPKAG